MYEAEVCGFAEVLAILLPQLVHPAEVFVSLVLALQPPFFVISDSSVVGIAANILESVQVFEVESKILVFQLLFDVQIKQRFRDEYRYFARIVLLFIQNG